MIILASNSPRRKQLLALGGWDFQVIPAQVDETPLPDEAPRAYVLRLAEEKARRVASASPPGSVVVAADTSVVHEGDILGKPSDSREAIAILRRLRDRCHQVYTGLATLRVDDGQLLTDVCVTDVTMRDYSDAEIQAYVATGDPLDKAGAYAIQHAEFKPVERIEGCYANVVGLPLCTLARLLKQFGLRPPNDLVEKCLSEPDQPCVLSVQVVGLI